MKKVLIEIQSHNEDGQSTCCICAYHGFGTGSRCWGSMISTVYVNHHRVGILCPGCLRDLKKFHEDRGCVVVTQPFSD